ncbi:MAG: PHP domain-containing protein [Formosimonas sp.]
MSVDFHFHSNCSDGALSPRAVVARAVSHGATMLALTDHDQLAGLPEARAAADDLGVRFINGVEISVSWRELTVHVVGLNFDERNAALRDGLAQMANSRAARAQKMGEQLAQVGIHGAYEAALALANGRVDLICRTHFARDLVARRKASNVRAVFMDYLVDGKPGFVPHQWVALNDAVAWIVNAGGVAVLAHPGRYAQSDDDEFALLNAFKAAGGRGIEVVTGSHSKKQYKKYAQLALDFGFYASRGSDFHAKDESKMDVGKVPVLPQGLTAVESLWLV